MNEYTENRFGYLRELSTDEKLRLKDELTEEIERLSSFVNDKNTPSEQKTDFFNDISYDREKLNYLNAIMEEKHL